MFFTRSKHPLIHNDTIDAAEAIHIHMAKLTDYATYKSTEWVIIKLICPTINEMWY